MLGCLRPISNVKPLPSLELLNTQQHPCRSEIILKYLKNQP